MRTIVHISADFPDPLQRAKTRAVEILLAATGGFRHVIYSLNRVSWRRDLATLPFGDDRLAVAYGAPPYGIGLARYLEPVADLILRDLEQRGIAPDLVHAHKFSVEGLVAQAVAERLRKPFVANLWGDTDIKIVEAKRGLRGRYRTLASKAALLLPAAPWTTDYFRPVLGLDAARFEVLPVMTAADRMLPPRLIAAPHLVCVLNLDSWRRKGLDTLARAVMALVPEFPGIGLDVYGGGSPKTLMEIAGLLSKLGAGERVRLQGPLVGSDIQAVMNRYAAFVMPTRRETYGMVHVEAVLAGVPILWSKDRGIDGLLDDVGYRCDPTSLDDVTAGIRHLLAEEEPLKRAIGAMQAKNAFAHLRRDAIAAQYASIVNRVT
jgi:glycosyltransferase involved in cell wall biosynthesis